MANILELIRNEKVEWKKLGEIKEITVVTPKTKLKKIDYKPEGKYPIIDQGQEFIVGYTNEESVLFDLNEYVIFGDHTESVKYVDFRFAQGADGIKVLRADNKYIKSRYLYHAILSFYEQKKGYMRHFSLLKQTEIPIPSPEIQKKIVEILDKFTGYVTELQSELQSRTKQYTYYRDMLLSEEYLNKITKEMEEDRRLAVYSLDQIFDFKNGLNKGKEYFGKGTPFVSYVNVYKLDRLLDEDITEKVEVTESEIERFSVKKGDVLFTRTSEVKEEVGFSTVILSEIDNCVFNGFTIRARPKKDNLLIPSYCAHLFRSYEVRKEIIKRSSFTTRASLSGQELGKVKIVIPPLSLQNKIVKVLDKFQLLSEDTKGLLPEEIEQRQKQYEYYREKLLTFDIDSDSTHARTHARTHNNI